MPGRQTIIVQVRPRWWLKHYLCAVVLVSVITGLEPDWRKTEYWIRRGLVLKEGRLRITVEA